MNKVIMMGRLTRDPEVRYYSQGSNSTAIARMAIAVDRRYKREGEPEADFFNCTAFGKQAEFIEKYLQKGTKILITGRIQNDTYEKDGVKHYNVQIMVDELEFAESKKDSSGSSSALAPATAGDGFMNIPTGIDDELPFA